MKSLLAKSNYYQSNNNNSNKKQKKYKNKDNKLQFLYTNLFHINHKHNRSSIFIKFQAKYSNNSIQIIKFKKSIISTFSKVLQV